MQASCLSSDSGKVGVRHEVAAIPESEITNEKSGQRGARDNRYSIFLAGYSYAYTNLASTKVSVASGSTSDIVRARSRSPELNGEYLSSFISAPRNAHISARISSLLTVHVVILLQVSGLSPELHAHRCRNSRSRFRKSIAELSENA